MRRNGTRSLRELDQALARVERAGIGTGSGGLTAADLVPYATDVDVAAVESQVSATDDRVTALEAVPAARTVGPFSIGDGAASLFPIPHNLGRLYPDVIVWDQVANVHVKGFDFLPIDANSGAIVFPAYVPTFLQFTVTVTG